MAKLGEYASFIMGQAPESSECNTDGTGTPFVKAGQFGESSPEVNEWTTNPLKMAEKNDVLICVVGATSGKLNRGIDCAIGRSVAAIRPNENVNRDYIYYGLHPWIMRLRNNSQGSAIGVITKDMLDTIEMPFPNINEQNEIVTTLQIAEQIIRERRKELKLLDELIQARFIEMFGNPLDKSLANKYFVECVEFNPKKSEVKDLMNEKVSFVPMECVGADGSFAIKEDGVIKDYYKGYTYFRDGDVLLAKITPCFENGKVAIAKNCTNGIGFGTTEFHVSRPIAGVSNSYWIKYMLKNENVHRLATINMTGSAGQKRIQTPFFEKLKIYLPPIELQNQFADFVRATDKLKVEVQKSLDETQMLFDSLMQKYFG